MPKNVINIDNNPFEFWEDGMEFEEFVPCFTEWYKNKKGGSVANGIAIRSDESLNRFRTIVSKSKIPVIIKRKVIISINVSTTNT